MDKSFITGFIKAATQSGFTEGQAIDLLAKTAGDPAVPGAFTRFMGRMAGNANDAIRGAGDWMGENNMGDLAKWIGEHPTVTGSVLGGAGGAGIGALTAEDKLKGALVGGGVGAGLGAGAGYGLSDMMGNIEDIYKKTQPVPLSKGWFEGPDWKGAKGYPRTSSPVYTPVNPKYPIGDYLDPNKRNPETQMTLPYEANPNGFAF